MADRELKRYSCSYAASTDFQNDPIPNCQSHDLYYDARPANGSNAMFRACLIAHDSRR